MIAFWILLSSL